MWVLSISLFVSLFYSILIVVFTIGWKRIPSFIPNKKELVYGNVTVVVACKNEEIFLPRLLTCLFEQSYTNFDLILVNDHSTDNTGMIMENAKSMFSNIQLITAVGYGKKNALREGILNSKNDFIITTDADCIPVTRWIETIMHFSNDFPSDLIICPVKLSDGETYFSRLQTLEFTSLVASGAGAAGVGMPIMCNAANLAFTKKAWFESQNDLHAEEQSGDDVFLLQSIKKRGGVIRFLKSQSAFVVTESSTSIVSFLKQRRRWASKAPSYRDWHIIYTAIVVLLINILVPFLFGLTFFNPNYFILFLLIFGLKYVLDTFFLLNVSQFYKLKEVFFLSFLLSTFYPFYIVTVGLSSIVFKSKKW